MPSSNTGEVDDECCILVVGVKMVYQSLDLVEGHVFITTAALTTALTTTRPESRVFLQVEQDTERYPRQARQYLGLYPMQRYLSHLRGVSKDGLDTAESKGHRQDRDNIPDARQPRQDHEFQK
jgi:hypothetical protein